MSELQRICAWCQKDMGAVHGRSETGKTHGICAPCKERLLEDYDQSRRRINADQD